MADTSEPGSLTVSLAEVEQLFEYLITCVKSREEVAEFATRAMLMHDAGKLNLHPKTEANRIWDAIQYFSGVDICTEPGKYLHTTSDFDAYRKQLFS